LESRDIFFYESRENENRLIMTLGSCAILFPEDVHRLAVKNAEKALIHKVIIKVKVDLI
jgi:YhcH/YjgK/YiaL family protein